MRSRARRRSRRTRSVGLASPAASLAGARPSRRASGSHRRARGSSAGRLVPALVPKRSALLATGRGRGAGARRWSARRHGRQGCSRPRFWRPGALVGLARSIAARGAACRAGRPHAARSAGERQSPHSSCGRRAAAGPPDRHYGYSAGRRPAVDALAADGTRYARVLSPCRPRRARRDGLMRLALASRRDPWRICTAASHRRNRVETQLAHRGSHRGGASLPAYGTTLPSTGLVRARPGLAHGGSRRSSSLRALGSRERRRTSESELLPCPARRSYVVEPPLSL